MGYRCLYYQKGIEYLLLSGEPTEKARERIKEDLRRFYHGVGITCEDLPDGVRLRSDRKSCGVVGIKLQKRPIKIPRDVDYPTNIQQVEEALILWFNTYPESDRTRQRDRFYETVKPRGM